MNNAPPQGYLSIKISGSKVASFGVDPDLVESIDVDLEPESVCLWQEKTTYQVRFTQCKPHPFSYFPPIQARSSKNSKPWFSLYRPAEIERLTLFMLYVCARNKGEHKLSAKEINQKYALNPDTLKNLDKEFEKNQRAAREERDVEPVKKVQRKK